MSTRRPSDDIAAAQAATDATELARGFLSLAAWKVVHGRPQAYAERHYASPYARQAFLAALIGALPPTEDLGR